MSTQPINVVKTLDLVNLPPPPKLTAYISVTGHFSWPFAILQLRQRNRYGEIIAVAQ